jgi:hypothetical protein
LIGSVNTNAFPYPFGAERVLVNSMVCAFLGRMTAAPRRSAIPKRCDERASANMSRQNNSSELRPPFETADQAINVDDTGAIRQRLLVRNRAQGVCNNNRDPSASRLRKDELEKAIKVFLKVSKIESPTKRSLSTSGAKDVEQGLSLSLPVAVYTNDKETKDFLEREAQKLVPGLKSKSGAQYRLNRWREEQLVKGVKLSYGDLVKEYVRLNLSKESFAQIPHGRYINFMRDFLAGERGVTWEQAVRAWKKLKKLDVPVSGEL